MSDVTQILSRIEQGDSAVAQQLLPLVYNELRELATAKLAGEKPGHTLQPTALVHEAYLRLVDVKKVQQWDSRGHFFAAAAEAMRRILVENARRKGRIKHGAGLGRVDLDEAVFLTQGPDTDLVALDDALTRFAAIEPVQAEVVQLRFFGGLTIDDAADVLKISRNTAKRYWTYARAWLLADLTDPTEHENS